MMPVDGVDPQVMRRSAVVGGLGVAALVAAAFVPAFRVPWILSAAAAFLMLGLSIPATSRARHNYMRVYLPVFLALAGGNGVADGVTAGSMRLGFYSAVRMLAVYVFLVGVLAIVSRRSQRAVAAPEQ